jgi:hypothetical protein
MADPEYLNHVPISADELLHKYADDIGIMIGTFGPAAVELQNLIEAANRVCEEKSRKVP